MPGPDTSEALSRVLQLKFNKFVVIFLSYLLTKVITYQSFYDKSYVFTQSAIFPKSTLCTVICLGFLASFKSSN